MFLSEPAKVFFVFGATDMRKGINGLSMLAVSHEGWEGGQDFAFLPRTIRGEGPGTDWTANCSFTSLKVFQYSRSVSLHQKYNMPDVRHLLNIFL